MILLEGPSCAYSNVSWSNAHVTLYPGTPLFCVHLEPGDKASVVVGRVEMSVTVSNLHYTCTCILFLATHAVEEFEIIEPSVIDQLGTSWPSPEESKALRKREEEEQKQSPRSRARQRWKNAIKQQIMLNQMEKKNELVKRKL